MRSRSFFVLILLFSIITQSCKKDSIQPYKKQPYLPVQPFNYEEIAYPDYFLDDPLLNLINTLNGANQVTNEGATLGRVLFYDTYLSLNNTVSCASCHDQKSGFSDNRKFSKGFQGGLSDRNSMSIVNIDFQRRFFWDARANSIEQQSLMPIEHPIEMGMDLTNLESKLQGIEYYDALFADAFGDNSITQERISLALGQFLKSIRSFNSKYDEGLATNFSNFTSQELHGKDLFINSGFGCINCHTTANFGGVTRDVNGLDSIYTDPGIGAINGNSNDLGRFKSVSLRNIELTAPYMHDGRFETLFDVMTFYSDNVQHHMNLDDRLTTTFTQGGPPKRLNLSNEEKEAMVSFLETLTDWKMVENEIYSNPFEFH